MRVTVMFACAMFLLSSPARGADDTKPNKPPIDLLTQSDAEAILGVTIQPPKAYQPFRSLLDPDFSEGKIDQGCNFSNYVSGRPPGAHPASINVEVRYAATPDPTAVEWAQKQVDERTPILGAEAAAAWRVSVPVCSIN